MTAGVIASMGRSLKTSAASFVEDLLERFAISEQLKKGLIDSNAPTGLMGMNR